HHASHEPHRGSGSGQHGQVPPRPASLAEHVHWPMVVQRTQNDEFLQRAPELGEVIEQKQREQNQKEQGDRPARRSLHAETSQASPPTEKYKQKRLASTMSKRGSCGC